MTWEEVSLLKWALDNWDSLMDKETYEAYEFYQSEKLDKNESIY